MRDVQQDHYEFMASVEQVKKYFAYWFQVGKPLIDPRRNVSILPRTIIVGDRYTSEFESLFQKLQQPCYRDCYFQGTDQTLGDLFSARWEIAACARCSMPVPLDDLGLIVGCPCADLQGWPNVNMPLPHCPHNVRHQLEFIHQRLQRRLSGFQ